MGLAVTKDNMTYKGTLLENEPMSRHTSWRIGGVADRFYHPVVIPLVLALLPPLVGDLVCLQPTLFRFRPVA